MLSPENSPFSQLQAPVTHAPAPWAGGLNFAAMMLGKGANLGALQIVDKLLTQYPEAPVIRQYRAAILSTLGRFEECIAECLTSLIGEPDSYATLITLAKAYDRLYDVEKSKPIYEQLRDRLPEDTASRLALARISLGELNTSYAIRLYEEILAKHPTHSEAKFQKALAKLTIGQYSVGWAEYESRWGLPEMHGEGLNPIGRWFGEDLGGQDILLYDEQGLGDTLFMLRYVPLLAARARHVYLKLTPLLHRIASSVQGATAVYRKNREVPAHAWHSPVMSLPYVFQTELSTIPAEVPYLHAPLSESSKQLPKPASHTQFKIGIVWAGNPQLPNDAYRSVAASLFVPLVAMQHLQFYSFQFGERASERAALGASVLDATTGVTDFYDSAELVQQLDLVIAVDTGLVHLAAALACPVWILLPKVPDFRWLLEREDSAWYPTARLFRQKEFGSWPEVFGRVAAALASPSLREDLTELKNRRIPVSA